MQFTYFGHACFAIKSGKTTFLFDPFITGNPLARHIDPTLIEADVIVVSHGHEDHIADLLSIANSTGALVIANPEIAAWVSQKGYAHVVGMNFGTSHFPWGTLSMVSALHSSSLPDGSYGGNPAGFILSTAEGCIYYAGDTGLTMEMSLIPFFAKIQYALLPIGGHFTMDAREAIKASDLIQCNNIIGVHYDTFLPIKINQQEVIQLFQNHGKNLQLPKIGETINL